MICNPRVSAQQLNERTLIRANSGHSFPALVSICTFICNGRCYIFYILQANLYATYSITCQNYPETLSNSYYLMVQNQKRIKFYTLKHLKGTKLPCSALLIQSVLSPCLRCFIESSPNCILISLTTACRKYQVIGSTSFQP